MEILAYNIHLKKCCKWVILPGGGIDINHARPHMPGYCINIPDEQRKDKMAYQIWGMKIHEGLFLKWDNKTSAILLYKVFGTTNEADLI